MTTAPSIEDIKPRRVLQKEKGKQREKQNKNRKLSSLSSSLPVTQSPALNEYISVLKSPESRFKIPERLNQVFKALDIPAHRLKKKQSMLQKKQETTPNGLILVLGVLLLILRRESK